MRGNTALWIAGALVVGLIVLGLAGVLLRLLWNSTIPELFGLRTIDTWQAIKLILISVLLFGSHRAVHPRGHWRQWHRDRDRPANEEQIRAEPGRNPGSASTHSLAPAYRILDVPA